MSQDQQILEVLERLWDGNVPVPNDSYNDPDVVELVRLYREKHSLPKSMFAPIPMTNALRALGCPRLIGGTFRPQSRADLNAIKEELDTAYSRSSIRVKHICPLDMLDWIPNFSFGMARVATLSKQELDDIFNVDRIGKFYPKAEIDTERFSNFRWLVVEESVPAKSPISRSGFQIFDQPMNYDHGQIEPHSGRFPRAVEEALFLLLLAPWEEWTHSDFDWRCFNVPWVHTVSDDLFARPDLPPTADDLSWEDDYVENDEGEQIYAGERPICSPLPGNFGAIVEEIVSNFPAWEAVRGTSLFETPIAHFFVSAYLSRHVDELLHHLTAIEAAVGTEGDYIRSERDAAEAKEIRQMGATSRLRRRLAKMLDIDASDQYKILFDLRSQYVHGRSGIAPISSANRKDARTLARRVICKLIEQANTAPLTRDQYLKDLLV